MIDLDLRHVVRYEVLCTLRDMLLAVGIQSGMANVGLIVMLNRSRVEVRLIRECSAIWVAAYDEPKIFHLHDPECFESAVKFIVDLQRNDEPRRFR